jgi:hypothetical protein
MEFATDLEAKAEFDRLLSQGINPTLISEGLNPYNETKLVPDDEGYLCEEPNEDFRSNIFFVCSGTEEQSLLALAWAEFYHQSSIIPSAYVVAESSGAPVTMADDTFTKVCEAQQTHISSLLDEFRERRATHLGVASSEVPAPAPDATLSGLAVAQQPPAARTVSLDELQLYVDEKKPVAVVVLGATDGLDVKGRVARTLVLTPRLEKQTVAQMVQTLPDMLAAIAQ